MKKRSVLTIAALALTTATAGTSLAVADSTPDTQAVNAETAAAVLTTAAPGSALAVPVATVDPRAVKAFKLFKDQPPSPMPADVAEGVGSSQKYGRNAKLARAISTPHGKGWVIPGRGYVCIAVPVDVADGYATSCQTTQVAVTNGLQIGVGGHNATDDMQVTTVAPIGSDVVAIEPDGAVTDAPTNSSDVSNITVPADATVAVTAP